MMHIHRWSPWVYYPAVTAPYAVEKRACRRCKKIQTRVL